MIISMTGYGRAESLVKDRKLTVEIKSLNHRNTEIIVRIPAFLSSIEVETKKLVAERVSRGRVEVSIRFDSEQELQNGENLEANMPLIKNYCAVLNRIRDELGIDEPVTLSLIAGLKGAFYGVESTLDAQEVWETVKPTLIEALEALLDMKQKEGLLLYRDMEGRLDLVRCCMEAVRNRAPEVPLHFRKRLAERIDELTGGLEIDESRLLQEVAVMAEKSDITEEIVRFESHVQQFEELLESEGAVGRKMDFLLQEMHREVNTVGYKCSDLEISHKVIEIKTELAKLREQAQNIE